MRFPGFEGEWKEYVVSELLSFFSTNSLSWDQLEYNPQGIQNIHYGLIHNGLSICVDVSSSQLPVIKTGYCPKGYTLCVEGDIVFADASENTNDVAKAVELIDCRSFHIVCGLHTIHGRDQLNITELGFKGYAFSSPSFHSQIKRIAQGTKVYSINQKNFTECYIRIPGKEEQQRIVSLLTLIDTRLSTQNKIIENLESLIKGISAKIFDNPNWQNIALGEMLIERNERSTINNQFEILSSTVNGIYSQREYFLKDIASVNNSGYKIVRKFDIVLSPQNLWMGNINFNTRFDVGIVSPSYKVFMIHHNYNKNFIAHIIKTHRALFLYASVSEQGASIVRRNLNMDALLELVFKMPSNQTQFQIGESLKCLKMKIEIEYSILRKLKEQKQYLLSSLFI